MGRMEVVIIVFRTLEHIFLFSFITSVTSSSVSSSDSFQ